MRCSIPHLPTALLFLLAARPAPASDGPPPDFQREIRPLLSDNCFQCHGPDARDRAAGLRLDRLEDATAPLAGGGAAVVPGSLEDSELVWRIRSEHSSERMPPPKSGKQLDPEQIRLLERWIEAGAPWSEHWAFVAPERPPVPDADVDSPVDAFVLERLRAEGLEPEPPADPATLLRRLTLDLTGLPPTLEELDAFLVDPSEEAWRATIERLLSSPRYGEHMARAWLDAARYADTHGLHLDNLRSHWPWRQWVVEAFRDHMPFDRFTVWQLAGDLLPEPTREQLVASGFNRNNPTSAEGGMIAEEYLALYAKDRVDTTATVWLGLTLGCAQCHDHKFDPFSQREYYSLFAFFNNLAEEASDRNIPNPVPFLAVPDAEQEARRDALDARLAELSARVEAPMPAVDARQAAFEREWRERTGPRWFPVVPRRADSEQGSTLTIGRDQCVEASGANPATDAYLVEGWTAAGRVSAVRLDALAPRGAELPGRAPNGNFVLTGATLEARPAGSADPFEPVPLHSAHATFSQQDYPVAGALDGDPATGWAGLGRSGDRSALLVLESPLEHAGGSELRVRLAFESRFPQHGLARLALHATADARLVPARLGPWEESGPWHAPTPREGFALAFPPEQEGEGVAWTPRPGYVDGVVHTLSGEPAVTYLRRSLHLPEARRLVLGLGSDDGVKVWLDGELVHALDVARAAALDQDRLVLELDRGEHELLLKIVNTGGPGAFALRVLQEDEAGLPPELGLALSLPHPDDAARLRRAFRERQAPEWIALVDERDDLRAERDALVASFPTTLVSRELEMRRPAHVLERGAYDHPGEEVRADTPAALPPFPEGAPRDRLGLARWIVSRENPLTARVFVNRLWQQHLGTGLVKTAEDLGNQGERPSHPELLDWLAVEFMDSGWDVQHVQRLILTSDTYRQRSRASARKRARDPENRLLARGPRHRLDAEVIRDQALFLAGLLVERVGGPSVKPYQPAGLWKAVGYTSSNTANFVQDQGEDLYRRSLYTFWKRTSPPPNLQTFDAPSREACVVRRARTNTPLQALVLMNDPQFVEAARVFGARILREGGADDAGRAAWAFRLATARPPQEAELRELLDLVREGRERMGPEEAAALVAVGDAPAAADLEPGEHAAWTLLASLLLNLDETLNLR